MFPGGFCGADVPARVPGLRGHDGGAGTCKNGPRRDARCRGPAVCAAAAHARQPGPQAGEFVF